MAAMRSPSLSQWECELCGSDRWREWGCVCRSILAEATAAAGAVTRALGKPKGEAAQEPGCRQ